MNKTIAGGAGLISLALAAALAIPAPASADESTTRVNDSMIRVQQMDYLLRNGGYVLYQDTYSDAVGGRNATMVAPASRAYRSGYTYQPSTVHVVPAPAYPGPY
ncbi:hypothetical protein J5J86_06125 [Aquabacter sp. L1I39]|uniref:hypothetical protein n=1 Tax=Aquabacter sp. L1I39 TaxID=2820278 RepID=UPI001ADA24B6|nr:hypothetical protein [Aquabacter sp. L1I39]QTL04890.1 hypothetical protein J5J86_06125 [Aquabacter sp. L1I39]